MTKTTVHYELVVSFVHKDLLSLQKRKFRSISKLQFPWLQDTSLRMFKVAYYSFP